METVSGSIAATNATSRIALDKGLRQKFRVPEAQTLALLIFVPFTVPFLVP